MAFVVVSLIGQAAQREITVNGGRGWDGVEYHAVAEAFLAHQSVEAAAPFVYRIGTPGLAAAFAAVSRRLGGSGDLVFAFKAVNTVANVLTTLLLVVWFRMFLTDWRIRCLLVLCFLTHWIGPVRAIQYYPVYVDPWWYTFLVAGLIGIHHTIRRTRALIWLTPLVFAGTLFREAMAIVPIATLGIAGVAGVPLLLATGLAFWLVWSVASSTNEYTFAGAALRWLLEKSPLSYGYAGFSAFGPMVAIAVYNWRRVGRFLLANRHLLLVLLAIAAVGWVGGTDTERILYWSMPVVYLLVGISMEDQRGLLRPWPLLVVLVASQSISQRLFWTLPDVPTDFTTPFPILTIPSSRFQLLDLLSGRGDAGIETIALAEHAGLMVVLLVWLELISRRGASPPRTSP